jgi:hypothetical protein
MNGLFFRTTGKLQEDYKVDDLILIFSAMTTDKLQNNYRITSDPFSEPFVHPTPLPVYTLSTDALRALMTKQQKTALNMAKFIQNQSLLLLEKLNELDLDAEADL